MPLDDIEQELETLEEKDDAEGTANKTEGILPSGAGNRKTGSGNTGKIVAGMAVLLVCATLAYFLLISHGGRGNTATVSGIVYGLGPTVVNLGDGRTALKVDIVVEGTSEESIREIAPKEAMLRDRAIEVLSRKTVADIDTAVKRNRLKRELLDEFNIELDLRSGRLVKMYFSDFYYFSAGPPGAN